jgi:hypothetical protein
VESVEVESAASKSTAVAEGGPAWVVSPYAAEENLPSVGRSLFDFLVTEQRGGSREYAVPFPFTVLIARVAERSGSDPAATLPGVKQVLIPLGRSLQRLSAGLEFFKYPRVVAAVDQEAPTITRLPAMLLRDRLYLGYQEKAGLIEVISYNEAAGRFEFQLVKDYRAGGRPRVVYANRAVCMACHQNGAPIFSRPLWAETNANPRIAALLKKEGRDFYGLNLDRGVDVPNAIDNATDRANELALHQLLWREGCGEGDTGLVCRARLFEEVVRYKLSQERLVQRSAAYRRDVGERIAQSARGRWPQGLALGNPDIPNRDPLAVTTGGPILSASLADINPAFDPLQPRPPLEVWRFERAEDADRLVPGYAGMLAASDMRRLASSARLSRADAISVRDFAPIGRAIAAMLWEAREGRYDGFDPAPFRRARLMPALLRHLGAASAEWCCVDATGMPPARMDVTEGVGPHARTAAGIPGGYYTYCASCHQTTEHTPPNFLTDDGPGAEAKIAHCAARIYARLSMWRRDTVTREKTPMPPSYALMGHGLSEAAWLKGSDLDRLIDYAGERVKTAEGKMPQLSELLRTGYESLRPCLPDPAHAAAQ